MLPFDPGGVPFSDGLQLEVRQLRADRHPRRAAAAHDLVEGRRPRTGSPARSTRSTRPWSRPSTTESHRWAGTDRDSAKSPAGSVHQCASSKPGRASSRSTPARAELRRDLGAHLLAARRSRRRGRAPARRTVCRAASAGASRSTRRRRPTRATCSNASGSKSAPSSRLSTASTFRLNSAVTPCASSYARHQPGRRP